MFVWMDVLANTVGKELAYIDPNTGGMLFQILAVLFATFSGLVLVFSRQIKSMVVRIKRFFRTMFDKEP